MRVIARSTLVAFAAKLGVRQGDVRAQVPRVAEVGFDAERRRMTTIHRLQDGLGPAGPGDSSAAIPGRSSESGLRDSDAARTRTGEASPSAAAAASPAKPPPTTHTDGIRKNSGYRRE